MKLYEITYVIDDEQQEKLSVLAERYKKINGWGEKEMLQFAVSFDFKNDIETKIHFLENEVTKLEKDWKKQKEKPKQKYISDEEHEKCKKVMSAYEEEFDNLEISVVDAGRFGFVKLAYYKYPYGFEDAISYTNSFEMFLDLWEEWFEAQLLKLSKGTPMEELDYGDMYKFLSKDKQEELLSKKEFFAKKAGISAL